jgi:aminoglycoside phosphotransferase (APT) family kinase protein
VRRLALQVRDLGRDLHASAGSAAIHGDLHPGNVLVRRRAGSDQPILLDWGRARLASPLEDVASWLQSLGCWEPEARRRHDTLLRSYLAHRGSPTLGPTLREAYWMAGARNALSGALAHHLGEVARGGPAAVLGRAHRAIVAWLRVLRTADASRRG